MRKIIYTMILLMLLSGCHKNQKISLHLYSLNDPFILRFSSQLQQELETHYNFSLFDGKNSQIIQNENIDREIHNNVDLMIINPVDRLGAYSLIKKLRSRNIPVIFYNRQPLDEDLELWDQAYYVGAKPEQSGQIQAQMIMDLFGNDPKNLNRFDKNGNGQIETVILKGEQGHQDAEIRTTEVLGLFGEKGFQINVLVTEVANWSRDEAYEKMKKILEDHGDSIELLISNNDAMALGAISIMRQQGFFPDTNGNGKADPQDEKWIPIVGIDGLDEAIIKIEQGFLYGTVINDSEAQARAIAELIQAILTEDFTTVSYPLSKGKYIWIDYHSIK